MNRAMNKYGNRKVITSDGEIFDSQREAARYIDLKFLEKVGAIKDLKRQVAFELIPAQREVSNEVYKKGIKKGQLKEGKVIEKAVTYVADFVYIDMKTGKQVVEDSKGFRTPDYKIKKKLLLYIHGLRIKET